MYVCVYVCAVSCGSVRCGCAFVCVCSVGWCRERVGCRCVCVCTLSLSTTTHPKDRGRAEQDILMYVFMFFTFHLCMHVCIHASMYSCMYVCLYECNVYVCMYESRNLCIYHMYACMYVCNMYMYYVCMWDLGGVQEGPVDILKSQPTTKSEICNGYIDDF